MGVFTVKRGQGFIRYLVAQILRLPPAGEDVPVTLEVRPRGDREIWIRHFGGQRLVTVQWQDRDFLVEKAGLLHFVFRLVGNEDGIVFEFQHNLLLGIKIPRCAWLCVEAAASGADDHWRIEVTMSSPWLGLLTTYHGEVTPTS